MDDLSMLWLSVERPIVSQGHHVRVLIGSDVAVSVVGPLQFSVLDRNGEVVFTFQDHGVPQGKHLAAVFPVPRTLLNGLYSLHVDALSLSEQASIDINILDDASVSRWERFFEAAGNAAVRPSDDAFEEMDRASLEELADTYSETHSWEASASVWSFLANKVAAFDVESARDYCSRVAEAYLKIELKRQSPRTFFRDRNLTILAHVLPPGRLRERTRYLIETNLESDPVDNSLLFIEILLSKCNRNRAEVGALLQVGRSRRTTQLVPSPCDEMAPVLLYWCRSRGERA